MIKNNNKGFVLAETLVVTVFLMYIFTMLYANFYPLVGEYEKRESYDDVDGKYAIFWIKKLIEDPSYSIDSAEQKNNFNNYGYVRFNCSDIKDSDKVDMCKRLVESLQVEDCTNKGNNCNIFITRYRIGNQEASQNNADIKYFKDTVRANLSNPRENCFPYNNACQNKFITRCEDGSTDTNVIDKCNGLAEKSVFRSGLQEYILTLPDYKTPSVNGANYRVIASFKHTRDNNNYYSYATMEVDRQ
ncbi:MAG: hypothetical protein IJ842_02530 [Bacilli bacterium]|nr:hypothetical protein [Bacilli bacterium]